ncbi:hypothetical protein ElyMa_005747000 [Elysia marginata]|uniref:G-protein coupled receptors family 1 profile domain-containing protein n=1 Tax=Elysia marginata TaxID=1093978 RepID=A0AAV4FKW6_9GAST|nr:hypothetical protein ElyMa_005747000 [Elysia marginata]
MQQRGRADHTVSGAHSQTKAARTIFINNFIIILLATGGAAAVVIIPKLTKHQPRQSGRRPRQRVVAFFSSFLDPLLYYSTCTDIAFSFSNIMRALLFQTMSTVATTAGHDITA